MHPIYSLFYSISTLFFYIYGLHAQLINGQYYTNGLAISNAPAPNGEHTVGSSIPISIEVTGNGRLAQTASIPGSTLPTAFISLNIFLVSSQTNINVTVSDGPQLLAGEQGSTVKHLTWPIPDCLPGGEYNFTYYERYRVNQIEYFGITPIPISIRRPTSTAGASESCDGSVAPLVQPQISSPAPSNPFLDPTVITTTTFLTTQGVWLAEASMRATFPELLPETSLVQMNDNESIMTILQPSFPTNGATGVVMELPRETYSAYSMDARVLVPVNSAIGQEVITVMIVGQAGLTMMVLEALGAGII